MVTKLSLTKSEFKNENKPNAASIHNSHSRIGFTQNQFLCSEYRFKKPWLIIYSYELKLIITKIETVEERVIEREKENKL